MVSLSRCVIVLAAIIAAAALGRAPAAAQDQVNPSSRAAYYVEFRAAEMGLYGHSYIAYGRLGPGGRPASVQYADFHPQGGELGLAVGHVVPVAAGMALDPDVLKLPLTTNWRRTLTSAEYKTLTSAVESAKARLHVWSALAYNCNSFVGDMAEAVGLRSPSPLLFANAFVPALRAINETPGEAASRNAEAKAAPVPRRKARPPQPPARPANG